MDSSTIEPRTTLEYLCAEVLELSAKACHQNKRRQITSRHVLLAIENDAELKELLKDVTIPNAGVMPFIHSNLLPKSSKRNQPEPHQSDVVSQEI